MAVVHVLLVPVLLGANWVCARLLFFAAGDTGDGPPGLGIALLPAIAILLMTIIAYYISLSVRFISKSSRWWTRA